MELQNKTQKKAENIKTLTISELVRIKKQRRNHNIDLKKFFERYKRKDINDKAYDFSIKTINTFDEALMHELIYNNAIFEMVRNRVYMFIAQRSYTSSNPKSIVIPIIYFTPHYLRKHFDYNEPVILLSKKWRKILNDEVVSGHRYEMHDSIIEHINANIRRK